MKKIFVNLILVIVFFILTLIILLATVGIETDKFNKLISNNLNQSKNINLDLNTIQFKLDPKKLNLFLETKNPKINYRGELVPVQNVQVFVDFLSLFKSTTITFKCLHLWAITAIVGPPTYPAPIQQIVFTLLGIKK